MSDPILTVLKFFLLALVWLFFLRILRSVWVEIRTAARASEGAAPVGAARPGAVPASAARGGAPAGSGAAGVAAVGAAGVPGAAGAGSAGPVTGVAGRAAAPSVPAARGDATAGRRGGSGRAGLRVLEPAETAGTTYVVDGEALLGRASAADISLAGDSYVSSSHARLWVEDGSLWFEDLGSTNGSLVNGQPAKAASRLRPGDRISVGRTTFEVVGA